MKTHTKNGDYINPIKRGEREPKTISKTASLRSNKYNALKSKIKADCEIKV